MLIQRRILLIILTCLIQIFGLNAKLTDRNNQADYIILYHHDFESTLQSFKDWRQSKGLNVKMVDVDSVYSEFIADSNSKSIKFFFDYAYKNWKKPAPKYALLVGSINHIPSYKLPHPDVVPDSGSVDEYFVTKDVTKRIKPFLALGRFPVRNNIELSNIIFKTKKFEDNFDCIPYKYDLTVFTDKKSADIFEWDANFLVNDIKRKLSIKQIIQNAQSSYFGTKDTLIKVMNEGSIFLANFLHGSHTVWGYYREFSTNDFDIITLSQQPFILTANSCSQSFDIPDEQGIIEKILVHDTSNAVCTFASSGSNSDGVGLWALDYFYLALSLPNIQTIGDVILNVKDSIELEHLDCSLPLNLGRFYTLLGDPALRIQTDKILDVREKQIIAGNINLNCYPTPANENLFINFNVPNSNITNINIFDIYGKLEANLVNEFLETGEYKKIYQVGNLDNGVHFLKIQINNDVTIKKFIVLK